jgi:TrkA-N domain
MHTKEERQFASSLAFVLGFLVSIGLGYWGWWRARHDPGAPEAAHFLHRMYLTFQLFVLHPQEVPKMVPWQLQTARFMAPAVLAVATVTIITTRFRKRFRHMRFRRKAGHVIVCGAGVHGTRLAQNFAHDQEHVVLVDVDEKAPGMQGPEGRLLYRMVADSVFRDTLISAGAHRAERLIAVAGDDVVNSQIASTVRSLAEEHRINPGLKVLVQAEDATLAHFLEDWDTRGAENGNVGLLTQTAPAPPQNPLPKIEIFGANAIAADALFGGGVASGGVNDDNAILSDLERRGGHLLLAGDHPLLEAIVVASIRRGRMRRLREAPPEAAPSLRITIIGPGAERELAAIVQRWRPEPTVVELAAADVELRDEYSILTNRWLHEWRSAGHALVACEDELNGIACAVALSRALGKGVQLTRVRTQPLNELDNQLQAHTQGSTRLATISVRSIADLAWGHDTTRIDQISPHGRLAAALRAEGLDEVEANDAAESVLAQHWLAVHSDPAPRIALATAPLVEGLLRAASTCDGGDATVSASALVGAGLTVDLDSLSNIRRAADQLSRDGSDEAFAAWCEYARRVPDDADCEAGLLAPARAAGELGAPLRLKAAARDPRQARAELEPDPLVVEWIRSRGPKRIAIFAGGAASMSDQTKRATAKLLEYALQRYDGWILTGGSDVGLCGVVREAASAHDVPVLGYAPAGRGVVDAWLRSTRDGDFSEAEPVAMWTDVLAAGRGAADVRMVAFPGGRITRAEILLARALGAAVASLDPREDLPDALDDTLPFGAEGVLELPTDPMTLRSFLAWPNTPLDPVFHESVARSLHNQYRAEQRQHKRPDDPALAPWERLPPTLQRSNLLAVEDIPNKLHMVGKRLLEGGSRLVLDAAELELLAEMEHGRFNYERLSAGWELGEGRHVSRLISPYLKPWSDLDEQTRQWDRDAVCAIDSALSEAGWGVTNE